MPKNINCINVIITLDGTEKIKTERKKEKRTRRQSEEYFFLQSCKKTLKILQWLLDFDWLLTSCDYLILTFHWFISAG